MLVERDDDVTDEHARSRGRTIGRDADDEQRLVPIAKGLDAALIVGQADGLSRNAQVSSPDAAVLEDRRRSPSTLLQPG